MRHKMDHILELKKKKNTTKEKQDEHNTRPAANFTQHPPSNMQKTHTKEGKKQKYNNKETNEKRDKARARYVLRGRSSSTPSR